MLLIGDLRSIPATTGEGLSRRCPQIYRDETVLLTMLVLRAWRLSLEKTANWLSCYQALAVALGMSPDGRTISAVQVFRRSRQMGV